jgi:hypothetical protein
MLLGSASADAAWQPATRVSSSTSSPSEDLTLASNARGEAVLVWRNSIDPYNSTLEAVRRSADGSWGHPVIVSDPAEFYPDRRPNAGTGHPDDPSVAVAPNGEAIIAWAGPANSTSDYNAADFVRVMVVPPGQLNGPRITLARAQTTRVKTAVGYDDRGNATLFFSDQYGLSASTRPAGGSFSAPRRISRDGEMISDARFAFAANGAVAGIFNGGDGIGYVVRDPGHALSRGLLMPPVGPVQGLNVAINDSGAAVFGWSQCANPDVCDRGELKARYRPANGPFGPVEPIVSTWASPALAVSPAGEVTAVFAGTSAEAPLLASTRPPGGRFGAPRTVATIPPGGALTAAYDRTGNLHAAWNSYYGADPEAARPWVTMRPAGGTWSAPYSPPNVPNLAAGVLARGAGDRMLSAWYDFTDVRASEYAPGSAPGSPAAPAAPADVEAPANVEAPATGETTSAPGAGDPPAPGPPAGPSTQAPGAHPIAPSVDSFTRKLSSMLARSGVARLRRGRAVPVWFAAPATGRLTITLSLGGTAISMTKERTTGHSLVTLRPRAAALKRASAAMAGRRRPALRLRVEFRPDGGSPVRSSRIFRPKR